MQKKRCENGSPKQHPPTGWMFTSKFTTTSRSFAAALQGNSEQRKRPHLRQDSVAGLIDHESSENEQQQERGQLVRDPNINSLPSDDIVRASI
jgi:hypothetical protein